MIKSTALALLLLTGSAQAATTVTFDTLGLVDGAGWYGPTWVGHGVGCSYGFDCDFSTNHDRATFSEGQLAVSFDVGNLYDIVGFGAAAYDALGNMIDSVSFGHPWSGTGALLPFQHVNFTGTSPIMSVAWGVGGPTEFQIYRISNFTLSSGPYIVTSPSSVPLPSALPLFATGLAGLMIWRLLRVRRRSRA